MIFKCFSIVYLNWKVTSKLSSCFLSSLEQNMQFICCDKDFCTSTTLKKHSYHYHTIKIEANIKEGRYTLFFHVCRACCRLIWLLVSHVLTRKHFGFECPICDNKFKTTSTISNHIRNKYGGSCKVGILETQEW